MKIEPLTGTIGTGHLKFPKLLGLFSKPWLLILLFSLPLLIGLTLSLFTSSDMAFQRSGAVVVALAVFCAYLNYFLNKELSTEPDAEKIRTQFKNRPEIVMKFFKETHPDLPLDLAEKTITMLSENMEGLKERTENLQTIKEKIIHTEATAGILGTLIWGFGDLPFSS